MELSIQGQTININALKKWEQKIEERWADLEASVAEIKNAAPQTPEEQHEFNLFDMEYHHPNQQDDGAALQVTKV